MRHKHLLGILLLATAVTAMAAGTAAELGAVRVENRDHAGVVTIQAGGPFTHTEYRPTDTLMLVDLTGVSAARQDSVLHVVSVAGVQSYRVLGYRSPTGAEVARVELNLAHGASAKVGDIPGGVEIRVSAADGGGPVAKLLPVAMAVTSGVTPATSAATPIKTSHISGISVVRGQSGMDIEVLGSGPMSAKTMKLSGPDRIVLDIPNSILEGRTREIPVHSSDIREVRAAHYQSNPPATRVVVDMTAMRDFEVVPSANKLVLRFKSSNASEKATQPAAETPLLAVKSAEKPVAPEITQKFAETRAAETPAPTTQAQKTNDAALQAKAPATDDPSATGVKLVQPTVLVLTPPGAQAPATSLLAASVTPTEKNPATPVVNSSAPAVIPAAFTAPANQPAPEKAVLTGRMRADYAASRFVGPDTPPPDTSSTPGSASLAMQPAAVNAALQQQAAQQQPLTSGGPVTTGCTNGRYNGEPINVNFKDIDLKDFFRLVHDISGLNVVLDSSVKGTLTMVLDDVPWDQALAIVLGNNGLECQLQGNVLRIATIETLKNEAEARRAQQEAQALAVTKQTFTRYLSYAHARDVVPIVKKFLSSRGDVVADERSNAVIVDDIPNRQGKIDELLSKLDRKTPEVEIEARVVSATRTFLRDIGTQVGFGWGGRNFSTGGNNQAISPISALPGPGFLPQWLTVPNQVAQIPLFSNLPGGTSNGLGINVLTSNYRLDFLLSMAESRGLAKVLSRPRVITQNNIKAVIKQGQRFPVVTQAQLGGPPTVQYIDALLRMQVTPQITADNTIFLDIDVENTTIQTSQSANQTNPTLNTSQSTTSVLVSDGETVVIGGVIVTSNLINIEQVPLLGSIPILGNLFKHTNINTTTQELLFFITPKIIQT